MALSATTGDEAAIALLSEAAAASRARAPATAADWLARALELLPPGERERRLAMTTQLAEARVASGRLEQGRLGLVEALALVPPEDLGERGPADGALRRGGASDRPPRRCPRAPAAGAARPPGGERRSAARAHGRARGVRVPPARDPGHGGLEHARARRGRAPRHARTRRRRRRPAQHGGGVPHADGCRPRRRRIGVAASSPPPPTSSWRAAWRRRSGWAWRTCTSSASRRPSSRPTGASPSLA